MTGKFLQEKRREKKLSQEELARKCNISIASIRNWEQGVRDPNTMSIEIYKKLCFVLNLEKGEGL